MGYVIDPEKTKKACEELEAQMQANYDKYNDNGFITSQKLLEGTILDSNRRFDDAFGYDPYTLWKEVQDEH